MQTPPRPTLTTAPARNTPAQLHTDSGVPHGHVPAYLPGSASLVEELDQPVLVVLRDGKHLVGVSFLLKKEKRGKNETNDGRFVRLRITMHGNEKLHGITLLDSHCFFFFVSLHIHIHTNRLFVHTINTAIWYWEMPSNEELW